MTGHPSPPAPPRRFELWRDTDPTGVSGTGRVATGVELPDGRAVVCWLTGHASTVVWPGPDGMAAVTDVHGHGGHTRVVYLDPPATAEPVAEPTPRPDWTVAASTIIPTGSVATVLDTDGYGSHLDQVSIGHWFHLEALDLHGREYAVRLGGWHADVLLDDHDVAIVAGWWHHDRSGVTTEGPGVEPADMTHPTPDAPVYTRDAWPRGPYTRWYKTTPTPMTPITGPCTIVTKEGPYHLPEGWTGWCAVDPDGDIYPIEGTAQARTYVPVDGQEPRS